MCKFLLNLTHREADPHKTQVKTHLGDARECLSLSIFLDCFCYYFVYFFCCCCIYIYTGSFIYMEKHYILDVIEESDNFITGITSLTL